MSAVATAVIPLPPRVRMCLELAAEGMSAAEIGRCLEPKIGKDTVETHLARARAALGARNTTQAVAIAIRKGYLL